MQSIAATGRPYVQTLTDGRLLFANHLAAIKSPRSDRTVRRNHGIRAATRTTLYAPADPAFCRPLEKVAISRSVPTSAVTAR
jgi:hypothetical protein